MDALLLVPVQQLGLLQEGVCFDLVHGGGDGAVCEERGEAAEVEVGDTDGAELGGGFVEGLERFPGFGEGGVGELDGAVGVGGELVLAGFELDGPVDLGGCQREEWEEGRMVRNSPGKDPGNPCPSSSTTRRAPSPHPRPCAHCSRACWSRRSPYGAHPRP